MVRWMLLVLLLGVILGGILRQNPSVKPAASQPITQTKPSVTELPIPQNQVKPRASQIQPDSSPIITHGPRNAPRIALTFDADMTPGMRWELLSHKVRSFDNTAIYQILNQTQTKATFFLSGMWIELYPDETRNLARDPLFELENHSYSHPGFHQPCYGLPRMTHSENDEVLKTKTLLKQVAGVENRYFRFPGGCADPSAIAIAQKAGLRVVHWDVVGGDADQHNPKVIEQNILRRVRDGSIIILHSHGGPKVPATTAAVRVIIPALKAKGFEFVKLSELLADSQVRDS